MFELINDYKLQSIMTDVHGRLGLSGALALVQDNMCEFFRMLKCDGFIMEPQIHCFWVVTKTNIKLLDSVDWLENITVKTYLSKKTNVRLNLTTEITKKDGCVLAVCHQEICAMGSVDRKIRLVKDTFFPTDIDVVDDDFTFNKIDECNLEQMECRDVEVKFSNIDFCMHTNNLEYVKFMLDCYPLDFWQSCKVVEFDIQYISESRCGDLLKVYTSVNNDKCCFVVSNKDNTITKGQMLFN
jgi:acyl-ACP thioesterase